MSTYIGSRIHARRAVGTISHGTQSGYKSGCHCDPCTEGARRAANIYRLHLIRTGPRTIDPTGTRRRVLALGMIGWPLNRIATEAGLTPRQVQRIAAGKCAAVHVNTAAAIIRAYDALSMTPAPVGRTRYERAGRALVRRAARLHGGHVPLAWDDDLIDDPDAAPVVLEQTVRVGGGRPVDEVVEDIEWLLKHDPLITASELARRLGYVDRSAIQNALRADRGNRPDLLARLARNAEVAA